MRKLVAGLVAGIVLGSSATAVAGVAWRVVGKGTGTGTYAIANVTSSVKKPKALAIRSTAGTAEVTWSYNCSGTIKSARRNVVYALAPARADDCTVSALASAEGRVSVQVLKR